MNIGYCRSYKLEELKLQQIQLHEAGCERIFSEACTGKLEMSSFQKMSEVLREGDLLIVPSLYVFPVTMIELVNFLSTLYNGNIKFRSIREKLTALEVFPYLDTYHKRSRSERAVANLDSDGKKAGKKAGRPKGLSPEAQKEVHAVAELYEKDYTIDEIMEELGMTSRSQVYKRLREAKIQPKRRKVI